MKVISVMSGKGGVGKSSVCVLLSLAVSEQAKVILLDFDICGPSTSTVLNAGGKIYKSKSGLTPISVTRNLEVVSMQNLIKDSDSVIWRGPKKIAALNMFFESATGYDYVIIDTPPGLSEEHWFLCGKEARAIIVTTPQNIALSDALSSIEFCMKNGIPVLGIFENMSGLKCEKCSSVTNVFGAKGGESLARRYGVDYLGCLPVDKDMVRATKSGCLLEEKNNLVSYKIVKRGIESILNKI